MSNLRYYIAIFVGIALFLNYWFGEDPSIYYERPTQEQSAIEAGKELATNGRDGKIMACASCHGEHGEGMDGTNYPRLAGLNPFYIKKQLEDFARDLPEIGVVVEKISRDYEKTPRDYKDLTIFTPGVRHDDIMTPMAKAMSSEDMKNLAAYYSTMAFKAKPKPVDHLTMERGEEIAVRGKPEYMVPRCEACHGPKGEGFRELFPPLAGQSETYLIEQINRWQNGQRDNDNLSIMKNVANMLTDADKVNIARYYSNMSYSINEEK